jgi:hypothetical protein
MRKVRLPAPTWSIYKPSPQVTSNDAPALAINQELGASVNTSTLAGSMPIVRGLGVPNAGAVATMPAGAAADGPGAEDWNHACAVKLKFRTR